MSPIEQIQEQLRQLPLDKQGEVLAFVTLLQQQAVVQSPPKQSALTQHPAFGSWRARNVDALNYERTLRTEWDQRT